MVSKRILGWELLADLGLRFHHFLLLMVSSSSFVIGACFSHSETDTKWSGYSDGRGDSFRYPESATS